MTEKEIIVERLSELEMRVVKNIALYMQIENPENYKAEDLVDELADAILDENSKVHLRTRTEIKRILLKYGIRIHNSDLEFEKALKELKEKLEREQRIILRAYEIELNEYFSDPTTFSHI